MCLYLFIFPHFLKVWATVSFGIVLLPLSLYLHEFLVLFFYTLFQTSNHYLFFFYSYLNTLINEVVSTHFFIFLVFQRLLLILYLNVLLIYTLSLYTFLQNNYILLLSWNVVLFITNDSVKRLKNSMKVHFIFSKFLVT